MDPTQCQNNYLQLKGKDVCVCVGGFHLQKQNPKDLILQGTDNYNLLKYHHQCYLIQECHVNVLGGIPIINSRMDVNPMHFTGNHPPTTSRKEIVYTFWIYLVQKLTKSGQYNFQGDI